MLDIRKRLEDESGTYSRYQELLQTEIADELEKPKGIPMNIRIHKLLGII